MKYRKKPVVIEAWQLTPEDDNTRVLPPSWFLDALVDGRMVAAGGGAVTVFTTEGTMFGDVGDWIIQGVEGELYPCRDSVFQVTYEAVE